VDITTGWVLTQGKQSTNDTSYIFKTTNGGINWITQFARTLEMNVIQFTDQNTGYAAGGSGSGTSKMFKTTNGGLNWQLIIDGLLTIRFDDIYFVNKDTGWVSCNSVVFGGLWKTTDGAQSWTEQLNQFYQPYRMSFINKDTGWVAGNNSTYNILRTTNGGENWNLIYTENTTTIPESIFFLNGLNGWARGGTGNGVIYTTNGGFNWANAIGNTSAGFDMKFINNTVGYSGMQSYRIPKSTDGGKTWGYQISPIQNNMAIHNFRNDTLHSWAGGTGLVKTTDGGGTIISDVKQISSRVPNDYKLYQNYPNPFNPSTTIKFDIKKTSLIKLKVFDITGKEIAVLADEKKTAGTYELTYTAVNISSGIYFYSLFIDGIIADTKKMLMLK